MPALSCRSKQQALGTVGRRTGAAAKPTTSQEPTCGRVTRVVSFNINGVRARLHQIEALKQRYDPDIIGRRRPRCRTRNFREMIEALGYQVAYYGQKGHYGVALLSKAAGQRQLRVPG